MSNLKEELIKKARKGEPALKPFSELQVIKNLLALAGHAHAMEVAAHKASEIFGYEWTEKKPKTSYDIIFRNVLCKMVEESSKQEGDIRYVRWQRFQAFGRASYLDQILTPPTNKKAKKLLSIKKRT